MPATVTAELTKLEQNLNNEKEQRLAKIRKDAERIKTQLQSDQDPFLRLSNDFLVLIEETSNIRNAIQAQARVEKSQVQGLKEKINVLNEKLDKIKTEESNTEKALTKLGEALNRQISALHKKEQHDLSHISGAIEAHEIKTERAQDTILELRDTLSGLKQKTEGMHTIIDISLSQLNGNLLEIEQKIKNEAKIENKDISTVNQRVHDLVEQLNRLKSEQEASKESVVKLIRNNQATLDARLTTIEAEKIGVAEAKKLLNEIQVANEQMQQRLKEQLGNLSTTMRQQLDSQYKQAMTRMSRIQKTNTQLKNKVGKNRALEQSDVVDLKNHLRELVLDINRLNEAEKDIESSIMKTIADQQEKNQKKIKDILEKDLEDTKTISEARNAIASLQKSATEQQNKLSQIATGSEAQGAKLRAAIQQLSETAGQLKTQIGDERRLEQQDLAQVLSKIQLVSERITQQRAETQKQIAQSIEHHRQDFDTIDMNLKNQTTSVEKISGMLAQKINALENTLTDVKTSATEAQKKTISQTEARLNELREKLEKSASSSEVKKAIGALSEQLKSTDLRNREIENSAKEKIMGLQQQLNQATQALVKVKKIDEIKEQLNKLQVANKMLRSEIDESNHYLLDDIIELSARAQETEERLAKDEVIDHSDLLSIRHSVNELNKSLSTLKGIDKTKQIGEDVKKIENVLSKFSKKTQPAEATESLSEIKEKLIELSGRSDKKDTELEQRLNSLNKTLEKLATGELDTSAKQTSEKIGRLEKEHEGLRENKRLIEKLQQKTRDLEEQLQQTKAASKQDLLKLEQKITSMKKATQSIKETAQEIKKQEEKREKQQEPPAPVSEKEISQDDIQKSVGALKKGQDIDDIIANLNSLGYSSAQVQTILEQARLTWMYG
ncbi:MAG: hypothetical protein J4432_03760 [DPANN group archaeon]|nr:hypothetical protein [DPANN group archaeon]